MGQTLRRLAISLCLLSALFLVAFGSAQPSLQKLHRHVPSMVANGKAALVGALPNTQRIQLTLMLPLRNQPAGANLLSQLYDPSSPEYHHFLTVQQFTDQFGPTQQDYDAVVKFAQNNGFTIVSQSKNRLTLDVSGTVGQINKAFHVSMNLYRAPNGKRTFYSIDREPTLNLSVQIAHIEGLNNYSVPHPMVHIKKSASPVADVTGSGPGGYYLGSDMRAAYYGGSLLTGAGQCVGLFEYGGYRLSDVNLTFSNAGQSYSVPINNVLIDGASAAAGSDDTEEVLDIAQAIGMAPGLSQVRVYIGPNDADILGKMASEDACKQLSVSWSWVPDDPSMDDPIFQEFAYQGQSIFVASGDYGAYDPSVSPYFYPAEDANVTAVGATHLTTNYGGGPWVAESAWNTNGYGSGGGISPDGIPLPSWQQGIANWPNAGSNSLRNVPEVSMEGDNDNFYCDMGTCGGGAGGTSFAAPRWAGFMALVNQQAEEVGSAVHGGLGFINPSIYSLGEGSSFTTDFHDVTDGNNDTANQVVWYNAVTGYDLVTGWGSPNGQNLIDALAGTVVPGFWLSTSPQTLSLYQGDAGTTTVSVTDAGGFTGNVSLAASGLPAGVTASFNPTSTPGTSQLLLTADSSATVGTATITITGTSGISTSSIPLVLTINPAETSSPSIGEFGSVNIGATSNTMPLTLTIETAGTLSNIDVLTQGSPNLDFTDAGSDTCAIGTAYAAGATCTVNVSFAPKYPGARYGAVVLRDANGNPLAETYLQGSGTGPQTTFNPGSETAIGTGFAAPEGVAILGNGSMYVADYGNSTTHGAVYLEQFSGGSYTQSQLSCTFSEPADVAVDGGGTLYVADPGAGAVYKVNTTNGNCTQTAIGSGFAQPLGVAVDGSGNVYIAATGNQAVYKEALQSDGTYVQTTIGNGWLTPVGVAVDGKGNIYIADYAIPGVFMETPSGGNYTQTLIGQGWTAPFGIAVDSAGNVYVTDAGNVFYEGGLVAAGVYKEVPSGTNYIQTPIGAGWTAPYGLAVDPAGNVEVADELRGLYKEDFADPPQLAFGNTTAGISSSDSPRVVTVSNLGTAALNFSAVSYPADFPEAGTSTSDCTPSSSLNTGQTCTLSIQFQPNTSLGGNTSLLFNENISISTNTLNTTATQQSVSATGTEVLPGGSVVLDVSADPSTAGNSVTFTATIAGSSGGPTPTGTVTFYNVTTPLSSAISLSNGVATYTTSSLAVGTYAISASYSGDSNYASSSSNTINESILTAAGTAPIGNTNAGTLNLGSTGSAIPLTITFTEAETLGSISVLTEGAPNLDFANAGGGTCTVGNAYTANSTCTVNVTFSPKYPGARYGAVVLKDNNSNVIGTGYLQGKGIGPQASFPPGVLAPIYSGCGSTGCQPVMFGYPQGIAVDGSGNFYVADASPAFYRETFYGGPFPIGTTIGSGFTDPYGIAVDAAGNIYLADRDSHVVYKETTVTLYPAGGTYTQTAIGYGFDSPAGIAVDGFGNVYVADSGNAVSPGAVYAEIFSNGSYTQTKIAGTFVSPKAVAVDGNGDIFVADSANGNGNAAIYKLTPSNGTYIQTSIGYGWATPTGIAVDGNGNVFVTDDDYDLGNGFVAKETLQPDGTYAQSIIADKTSVPHPSGIALDQSGNRYITDNLGGIPYQVSDFIYTPYVFRQDVADPPSLSFAATLYSLTSSDSPKTVTIQNVGNAALAFSALSYPTDFPEAPGVPTDCTAQSSLQTLSSCTLSIDFKPGTPLSSGQSQSLAENVAITTNSLGASTQNLAVAGTEATPADSIALSAPANIYVVGATITFTATVTGQSGLGAPTGTVTFYSENSNGNTALGTSSLSSNGTATYSTNSLATTVYSIIATYSGDQIYASATSSAVIVNVIPNSSFGTENIGSTSTAPVTVTFSSHITLGSIAVLTDGMPNLDFTNAGGGTCTIGGRYSSKSTCTVKVSFQPRFAGTRHGALLIGDNNGNLIDTLYLHGTGVGPQVAFQPAASTTAFVESSAPCAQVVDGSGDIYVSLSANGTCGSITKWTPNNGSYTQSTVPSSALSSQIDIAVDGAGNLYIADTGNGRVLKEAPFNGTYSESVIASGLSSPRLVQVDGSGEIYFVVGVYNGAPNSSLYEEVPSSSGGYTQTVLNMAYNGSPFTDPAAIAIDDEGHLYVDDRDHECCDTNGSEYFLNLFYDINNITMTYSYEFSAGNINQDATMFADANGNLYVTFEPSTYYKYVHSMDAGWIGTPMTIGGWGMDGSGNLYRTVDDVVTKVNFASPPSLRFAQTDVGSKSSDSPKTATLQNIGNAPLIFSVPISGANPSVSANFELDSSSTCPQIGASGSPVSLAMNSSCTYAVNFNPTTTGTIDGSVIASDNALNAVSGMQTVPLSGSGTSGGVGMAVLTIGPGGVLQGVMMPNQSPAGSESSGNVWVDTTHRTLIQGGVYLQLDSQGNMTCNVYSSQTQLTASQMLQVGTLYVATEQHYIQGCGTTLFPFQVARYTWGPDQSTEQNRIALHYSTQDGKNSNYYAFSAILARVTVTLASQSGSDSNPPLTATATLTNPPTGAEGYDWQITGGNGAIVFPNGQESMPSTTNSITVEEPNPTGTDVPVSIHVGVRYPTTVAAVTMPSDSDPLLYGPATAIFGNAIVDCEPASITRGDSVTCTATGPSGSTFSNWRFSDGTSTVSGTGTSNTWTGIMVTSGTVSVTITSNGVSTTASTKVTVIPRTGFAFTAVQPQQETNPYTCVGVSGTELLSVDNPPTLANGATDETIGQYCDLEDYSYTYAPITNGPNQGYSYILTATNKAAFHWIVAQDVQDPSSAFYQAQCGNYDAATNTGFISGAQLNTNIVRHESGMVQGHYGQYVTAQDDPKNNIGVALESAVNFSTGKAFTSWLTKYVAPRAAAISYSTHYPEPYQANYDQNGVFDGPINFSPYASCQ